MNRILSGAAILYALSSAALAQELSIASGHPAVIDGDTISLNGESLRLDGIDAPEISQPLGKWSSQQLAAIIDGRELVCSWEGVGRYNRPLALCAPVLPSGRVSTVSINAQMVRIGAAYAGLRYSYAFEHQQSLAMKFCKGVWRDAGLPWCYRSAKK